MRKSFLIVLAFVAPAPAYGSEGVSVQEPRSEPPLLTLADGRYFGYIRAIDTSTVPATLRFDRAEFLSGDEAYAAALADAAIEPGEPVSNDYYVDDPNRRLAQLEIAADVGVTAVRCPNSCRDGFRGRSPRSPLPSRALGRLRSRTTIAARSRSTGSRSTTGS